MSWYPVFCNSASLVLGPADRPPSMDIVKTVLIKTQPRALYLPPSIIEGMVQDPVILELMKKTESIVFAGGPLARPVGDMLSNYCKISPSYGSTEMCGITSLLPKEQEDWAWLEWHPALKVDMEPAVDGSHELVLKQDSKAAAYRALTRTILSKEPEFRSRDLFKPHPSRPGLWDFYARADDVIVFSSGEKWNPVPSESIIQNHELLSGALISGDGKFQPVLLLEPKEPPSSSAELIDQVWTTIESANSQSPRFGQLSRSRILVAEPAGFKRAGKGTIVRKFTIQKYADAIEALYGDGASDEAAAHFDPQFTPSSDPVDSIHDFVRKCAQSMSRTDGMPDDADFYICGLDSLETLELSRMLKKGLSTCYTSQKLTFLSAQVVFANPTVDSLANAISEALMDIPRVNGDSKGPSYEIQRMIGEFSAKLSRQRTATSASTLSTNGLKVVLTGSTGWLGRRLLLQFASSPKTSQIICLDRSSVSARSFAKATLTDSPSSHAAKIDYLEAKLDQPNFGLNPTDVKLLDGTDVFVHNAWKVDFNQSLSSFSDLISGVTNLANWAALQVTKTPHIIFTSSVASVANVSGDIPEAVVNDVTAPARTGYAQSKYVAERILDAAVESAGIAVTLLRVGQLAGDVTDSAATPTWSVHRTAEVKGWSKQEWVPALLRTSQNLGFLPDDLPVGVDWVPANVAAAAIDELTLLDVAQPSDETKVYHIVNTTMKSWSDFLPSVSSALTSSSSTGESSSTSLKIVPYEQWLQALKAKQADLEASDLSTKAELVATETYPALKLLPFFKSLLLADPLSRHQQRYQTTHTRAGSGSLARLEGVRSDWIERWITEMDL